jgi:hypothetical protein
MRVNGLWDICFTLIALLAVLARGWERTRVRDIEVSQGKTSGDPLILRRAADARNATLDTPQLHALWPVGCSGSASRPLLLVSYSLVTTLLQGKSQHET